MCVSKSRLKSEMMLNMNTYLLKPSILNLFHIILHHDWFAPHGSWLRRQDVGVR